MKNENLEFKCKECASSIKGRVIEVQRELYTVHICNDSHLDVKARVKGNFYKEDLSFPVIGDYVLLNYHKEGISVIEQIEERVSVFKRPDQSGHAAGYVKTIKDQILAANFDYLFIVTSLNQNFNLNRIARYITITLQGGAKPVVILTKADLCEDIQSHIERIKELSKQVDVVAISAKTGLFMDQLSKYLHPGITIALLGSSGVGKSTLVNTLAGQELMKVSGIREQDARGHHTTTHRKLFTLTSGVTLIDTPGIREIGVMDVEDGIDDTFDDIKEIITGCKYHNCTHTKEPGCAIKNAIDGGKLTMERFILYQKLKAESTWAASKQKKYDIALARRDKNIHIQRKQR